MATVSDEHGADVANGSGPLSLDPFSFHGNVASRIAGLGGSESSPDQTHVFHSHYVPAARGPNGFTIRFHNLRARRGTLLVRVHMLPDEAGAAARLVNSERVQLNRLVHLDGAMHIPFEGYRGLTYAVLGLIQDDTDASADGLTLLLDRPETGEVSGRAALTEARSTAFGSEALKSSNRLLSLDPATLATPVSQAASSAQAREPAYAKWMRELGEPTAPSADGWKTAYLAQVLDRYGVLQEGASALVLGAAPGPVAALAAGRRMNLMVVDADTGGDPLAGLHRPALCPPGRWQERVRFRAGDLANLPEDLANFDLAWSLDILNRFATASAAFAYLETVLDCLRPGGLAVHVFDADLHPFGRTMPIGRTEIERIALLMVSRGHDVAQLRPTTDLAALDRPAPFGLVMRRARTQL